MEMKTDRLLLDKASVEQRRVTHESEWHCLSMAVLQARPEQPPLQLPSAHAPLQPTDGGVARQGPATPNAGHVGMGTALTSKTNIALAQQVLHHHTNKAVLA